MFDIYSYDGYSTNMPLKDFSSNLMKKDILDVFLKYKY